ncbi:MAG TPA: L-fucose/L-arabinose isomerase family protein [Ktedonobacterales bacterium]|nr:L-fucose/L-arabinose isomerase family protein [Ktedonobacterales bacterium]
MTTAVTAPGALTSASLLKRPITLGVIVGNRGFFPDHLAGSGRETILQVLAQHHIQTVIVEAGQTNVGAIETLQEARLCADLFRAHRDEIDGVLVTLPNFGDERAIANVLRWSALDVPVLIHAFPDDPKTMTIADRRDSFCGKMSACNNLRQYNIPYTLTSQHTMDPRQPAFAADLRMFAGVCRVVRGLRHARVGALGARPTNFNTVRFSEKLLEQSGISVETLDLSEALGRIARMADDAPKVVEKLAAIRRYADAAEIPDAALLKMGKFGVALDDWITATQLDATAIQCWTAMEEYFGVVPCTLMSMASNGLIPSACETDVAGVVAMLALQLASGRPSAIVDWNNNYGDDPDKGVVFHCSNLPKDIFVDLMPRMDYQAIIAGTVGRDNTFGTIVGRVRENPFTYLRISTDDLTGQMRAYVGEGKFTADPLETFGGYGVVQVPRFQDLLAYICENGFEHHVSINQTLVARTLDEAMRKYLRWSVYYHK